MEGLQRGERIEAQVLRKSRWEGFERGRHEEPGTVNPTIGSGPAHRAQPIVAKVAQVRDRRSERPQAVRIGACRLLHGSRESRALRFASLEPPGGDLDRRQSRVGRGAQAVAEREQPGDELGVRGEGVEVGAIERPCADVQQRSEGSHVACGEHDREVADQRHRELDGTSREVVRASEV